MLVIVVMLFAICWLPLQTYYLLQTYFPVINEYKYINIVFFCFDWLAMSNSCYNPFIYGIYNIKFQEEFKQKNPFRKKRPNFNDSFENEKSQSAQTRMYSSVRSSNECKRCSCRTSSANEASHPRRTSIRYDFERGHTHTAYVDDGGGNRHPNNNRTRCSNNSFASKLHPRENRFVVTYNRRRNSDRFRTGASEFVDSSLALEDT